MKFLPKEITIAIVLGFFIGIIITYGIWNTNRALKQKHQVVSPLSNDAPTGASPSSATESANIKPTPSNSNLTLSQPEPHTLVNTQTTTISGFAHTDSTIVIYAEKNYQIIYPDSKGQFNAEVSLDPGTNHISVVAITSTGQQYKLDRTVVYSTTELEP